MYKIEITAQKKIIILKKKFELQKSKLLLLTLSFYKFIYSIIMMNNKKNFSISIVYYNFFL